MPYYLERFTDDVPLEVRHTLYREGFLVQEADLLVRQELPDERNHTSVLLAIAQGLTRKTASEEIDIVAIDHSGTVTASGSCKWANARLSRSEDQLLTATEPYIPNADDVRRHYFCSRDGFTDDLTRLAAADPDRYKLVRPADVYE
jgi:hypothetical protein